MSLYELGRQLRLIFTEAPNAISFAELLAFTDALAASPDSDAELFSAQLEQELQTIHHEFIDHSSLYHVQVLLAVLYHLNLQHLLTPLTVITFWFDLVLRPALREPRMPTPTVGHAKELILSAIRNEDEKYREKIQEFRTRLFDFYLLDALNEGSEEDVLDWVELDVVQRERKTSWKTNLEDILLGFHPMDLMNDLNARFTVPSSRLQLLMFINTYTSSSEFQPIAGTLATHPLMNSLLSSLMYDNSTVACTMGLTVLVKMLPILAVGASGELKSMIPRLFAIYVRCLCWKQAEQDEETSKSPALLPEIENSWQRLGRIFSNVSSGRTAPPVERLFTYLYYLFPCNLLRFFRAPVEYLIEYENQNECPYVGGWEKALDVAEIKAKSEHLIRGHICHPLLIWQDAQDEVSNPDFWKDYDVAKISSEAMSMDVRYTSIAMRERHQGKEKKNVSSERVEQEDPTSLEKDNEATERVPELAKHVASPQSSQAMSSITQSTPQLHRVSLQNMITTSVLLKSTQDIQTEYVEGPWPTGIFAPLDVYNSNFSTSQQPSETSPVQSIDESPFELDSPDTPHDQDAHSPSSYSYSKAISSLQREILLLRTELNFELWLSRENVKHIGRLFQDRVVSSNAEVERQGLYNKLRTYRSQVTRLESELKESKKLAASARQKHVDWSSELQTKLRELREEKKGWMTEIGGLRRREGEAEAQLAAQSKLLFEANEEVFKLRTFIKEHQHKIDRLKDYEAQIEQDRKMQRLWDADFEKFKRRGEDIDLMMCSWKQMEMRIESLEKTMEGMEREAKEYRHQIQSLQAQLRRRSPSFIRESEPDQGSNNAQPSGSNQTSDPWGHSSAAPILLTNLSKVTQEKADLMKTNTELRDKNYELKEELEELEVMIEELRGRMRGSGSGVNEEIGNARGLVYDSEMSPVLGSVLSNSSSPVI